MSFETQFYTMRFNKKRNRECIYGFPMLRGAWCNSQLKMSPLKAVLREVLLPNTEIPQGSEVYRTTEGLSSTKGFLVQKAESKSSQQSGFSDSSLAQGADINIVQYLGIAADEPERIERHTRPGIILPLVDIGWDEAYCRKWCEENDLLSPIYTNAARGGCWFCHNQGVEQLRLLRRNYPDLWELLLKWDWDSPVTFHTDGRTVHDFDLRFYAEDLGLIPTDRKFRWKMLEDPNFYKETAL